MGKAPTFVVKCPKCGHVFPVETVFNLEIQEEGDYVAFSPEHPRAVGQGETLEEAVKDLEEAVELLKEVLEEERKKEAS